MHGLVHGLAHGKGETVTSAPKARRKKGSGALRLLPTGRWQARAPHPTDTTRTTGPNGKRYVRAVMVTRSFETKGDAEAWLRSPTFEVESSSDADEARMPTFREYGDEWLPARRARGKAPLKPRTRDHYRKLLDAYLYPTFGDLLLDEITPTKVDRWHATLDARTATMNAHAYSLLRAVMATAVRQDRIVANPCRIEGAGQAERVHEPVMLTAAEVLDLRDAMPARYRAMVLLAAFCGLRFGELTELRRGDVDLEHGRVKVRRGVVKVGHDFVVGVPKSRAGRRDVEVPEVLVPDIEEHLTKWVEDPADALLFPARHGGWMSPSSLYKPFYRARVTIGHPDLRWHDLRHVAATLGAGVTGVGLADLQAALGHSTVTAAMRYQHATDDRKRLIADGIGEVIEIESRRRTASGNK